MVLYCLINNLEYYINKLYNLSTRRISLITSRVFSYFGTIFYFFTISFMEYQVQHPLIGKVNN